LSDCVRDNWSINLDQAVCHGRILLLRLIKLAEYIQLKHGFSGRFLCDSPICFLSSLRDYGEFVMANLSPVNLVIDSEYLTRGGQSLERKLVRWMTLNIEETEIRSIREIRYSFSRMRLVSRRLILFNS